jgi:hypothetical protein
MKIFGQSTVYGCAIVVIACLFFASSALEAGDGDPGSRSGWNGGGYTRNQTTQPGIFSRSYWTKPRSGINNTTNYVDGSGETCAGCGQLHSSEQNSAGRLSGPV